MFFNSASKIVFVLIALTVCGTFTYEVVVGKVMLEGSDFINLALMAFTFYFSNKGNQDERYLGK